MEIRFLSDENFNGNITRALLSQTSIDLVRVQDVGLSGEPDPVVLRWAADASRILLSHDFRTMPGHAYDRVREGLFMPGVFLVSRSISPGQAVFEIQLLNECSLEGEWEGQVLYLPL